jgi:tetratricopeptide (TPR) repeat protein
MKLINLEKGRLTAVCLVALLAFSATPLSAYAQDEAVMASEIMSEAHQKANALIEKDDYKAAIKVLKSAKENGEDNFQTNQLLVKAYGNRIDQVGMLKKRGLAVNLRKSMERSVELKPENDEARGDLIGFHLQAPGMVGGDKDKARELIKGFKNITPAERYVYQARVSRAEKDMDGAKAYLEKAIAEDKSHAGAYLAKTNMFFEQEAYVEAFKTAQSCVAVKPENMSCQYVLGKAAHVGDMETETGIAAMQTFIAAGGHSKGFEAHAHYRLGEMQARIGDKDAAKLSLQKAVDVNGLDLAKKSLKALE